MWLLDFGYRNVKTALHKKIRVLCSVLDPDPNSVEKSRIRRSVAEIEITLDTLLFSVASAIF
jgi:hypothetical protein